MKEYFSINNPKVWITAAVTILLAVVICAAFIHVNDVQNFQVVQSLSGNIEVRSDGGFYFQVMPRKWTYPKVNSVFFSNEEAESTDQDGINVIFLNKGHGDISCQVVYRLFTDMESITKMHQYAAGDMDIVDDLVLAKIKESAMEHASRMTSSQAVEDREKLADSIRGDIVNNKALKDIGIVVEQFSITRIAFDNKTNSLFAKQQEADLQKKTAEAEKQRLIMEKERTESEYAKQIAEAKGKAETEMMRSTTDAERQKKLAEIEASKKVEVEKLAKEEALVKAQKQLELAELNKKEEQIRLETIKIQAEQRIAEAKAKEQQIKLSGAISEEVRYRLDVEKETRVEVAKAIAAGLGNTKLPSTMIIGAGTTKDGCTAIENLLQLITVQKAKEVSAQK